MNITNLPYYLEDLTRLEELKLSAIYELIDQYPYMQQLRFLAAKKAHQTQDKEMLVETSEHAAMYTSYPEELYEKLVYPEKDNAEIIENGIVEIHTEIVFEEDSDPVELIAASVKSPDIDIEQAINEVLADERGKVKIESHLTQEVNELAYARSNEIDHIVEQTKTEENITAKEEEEIGMLQSKIVNEDEELQQSLEAEGLSDFSKWLLERRHLLFEDEPIHKPKIQQIKKHKRAFVQKEENKENKEIKKIKKAVKAEKTPKIKDKSDQINDQIASESLAELYLEQGYKKRAISMYEKLLLIFPEKSAYFAVRIQKIKEN